MGDDERVNKCAGVLYGGNGSQLAANACAVVAIFIWTYATSFVLFGSLRFFGQLRVHEDVEDAGMDESEHGIGSPLSMIDTSSNIEMPPVSKPDASEGRKKKRKSKERSGMAGSNSPARSPMSDKKIPGGEKKSSEKKRESKRLSGTF